MFMRFKNTFYITNILFFLIFGLSNISVGQILEINNTSKTSCYI